VTEDDETHLLASESPHRQGDLVLYDHFKHLTTLALLMLGGMLTLSQTEAGRSLKLPGIIVVVAVVTIAGVLAFGGATEIARSHFHGDAPKRLDFYRKTAPAVLSLGVGMFLYLFVKALGE
jgi:hypothetical protein